MQGCRDLSSTANPIAIEAPHIDWTLNSPNSGPTFHHSPFHTWAHAYAVDRGLVPLTLTLGVIGFEWAS